MTQLCQQLYYKKQLFDESVSIKQFAEKVTQLHRPKLANFDKQLGRKRSCQKIYICRLIIDILNNLNKPFLFVVEIE
jgi:hypothetical protein